MFALVAACGGDEPPAGGVDGAVLADARPRDAAEPPRDAGADRDASEPPAETWRITLGDSAAVVIAAVTVSNAGEPYAVGFFTGAVTIAGERFESAGGEDGVVLAFGVDGALRWSRVIGSEGDDRIHAITAADGTYVYVTGSVSGAIDLGGGAIGGAGGPEVLAASFDEDGAHRWSRVYGPGEGSGIATNATGNVDFTGVLFGEADFGGGPLAGSGAREAFIASVEADGTHRWSLLLGGAGETAIDAIANDLSCNVYLTGTSTAAVDLDGACPTEGSFVASWDQFGAFRWARCLPGDARAPAIAVTGTGRVTLAGSFSGDAAFDGAGGTVTSAGGRDALIVGLDRNGGERFAAALGGEGDDDARSVALDSIGRPYVAGARGDEGAFVVLWDAPEAPVATLAPALDGEPEAISVAVDRDGSLLVATRNGATTSLARTPP